MQDRKEQAKAEVALLVEKYQRLSAAQLRDYNEAQTKTGFIEPLFRALGWAIEDKEEVTLEERASNGRVDYAFKLRGVPRLYLEAKALGNDLTDARWARQAVTYAYHKGVTWAVLSSFSHLKVFNANQSAENPQSGLFLSLTAPEYVTAFDRLWALAKESTEAGLLEDEARKSGRLPPSLPVEKRLFAQLRTWREELFNRTAQYSHEGAQLTPTQVDEIIQRFFNRMIFIRTCEDRILEEKRLEAAWHGYRDRSLRGRQPLLEEVQRIFAYYRDTYDSDLFDHHLVDRTHIDEDILGDILAGLHGVTGGLADYDFSLIDADIMGAVYEQYLGHVAQIVVRRQREAQQRMQLGFAGDMGTYEVASKRERRKEQGIYYTPLWVTDYIVRQTVGAFIEEHKDRPDAIHEVKILDMACGSGSFLIRAYDYLLRWQAEAMGIPVEQLTQEYRMPLLRNNIFGADLDPQAIEIARLNLLLRALAQRELLPSLADNVMRGNSLISGTPEELKDFFGDGWEEKHPFNWEDRFPKVMGEGGFDIIVGNPPYVRPHKVDANYKKALWAQYPVYKAKADIYACFIQRAIDLLKPGGVACYIVSNTFMSLESFASLRGYILSTCRILGFGLPSQRVFREATVETIVLVLRKEPEPQKRIYNTIAVTQYNGDSFQIIGTIPQESFYHAYLNMFDLSAGEKTLPYFNKLEQGSDKLSEVSSFRYGLKTGDDKVFLSVEPSSPQHRRLLRRSDFSRYEISYKGEYVWYVPERMRQHRATARPGDPERFEQPKLLVQDIGKSLVAAFDSEEYYVKDALMFLQKSGGSSLKFLLGLINSRLLNHWYTLRFRTLSVAKNAILQLPIRRIDFGNATDKALHDRLVALVERMLALQGRMQPLRGTGLTEEQDLLGEIERVDREIDGVVYELYGLTEGERRLVEGET